MMFSRTIVDSTYVISSIFLINAKLSQTNKTTGIIMKQMYRIPYENFKRIRESLPQRWQSVIAARRQPAKSLILFLSSTLLRVILDFPGINEEIFATLPHSPGGEDDSWWERRVWLATRPSPPAEDEVSANGDKPSAGNEHFCGKLASSAFSSLFPVRMRKRERERERERENTIWNKVKTRYGEWEIWRGSWKLAAGKIFRTRSMILFHRTDFPRRELRRRVIQILRFPLF